MSTIKTFFEVWSVATPDFATNQMFQLAMSTFIPPHEVINRFGYLIKGKGKVSGLNFAKAILKSGLDCVGFRENNASTAASIIYEIEVFPTRGYKSVELL